MLEMLHMLWSRKILQRSCQLWLRVEGAGPGHVVGARRCFLTQRCVTCAVTCTDRQRAWGMLVSCLEWISCRSCRGMSFSSSSLMPNAFPPPSLGLPSHLLSDISCLIATSSSYTVIWGSFSSEIILSFYKIRVILLHWKLCQNVSCWMS